MVLWIAVAALTVLIALGVYDVFQTRHAIRRNFPLVGRLRYLLEAVGPELRQYIVTDNDEERPFSRDQRRWVYSAAKKENKYFGFGSDNHMDSPSYPLFRHAAFPYQSEPGPTELPSAKVLGEWRNRKGAFQPPSLVGISAMSFGSLSGPAIEALNRGASLAGCLHNTGEGGVSKHHLHGGELIFQLGTGYFGARTAEGRVDYEAIEKLVAEAPIRAIEIKLSQGAKPGLGGVLPGNKVTPEIAEARGVPVGKTVASPARHAEFSDVDGLIDFVERVATASGLPVGIKSAVGQKAFWVELAERMGSRGEGPDFISIDGGEGGTGAAPLVFSDHVSLLFRDGFAEVYRTFAQVAMSDRITWIGAGRLGFPGDALVAMSLGADMINVGREVMMAIGCIQAQECHTGHCPTGVATHNRWLTRGLDPTDKSVRAANYLLDLQDELLQLAHACGVAHPSQVRGDNIELMVGDGRSETVWERYGYKPDWFSTLN